MARLIPGVHWDVVRRPKFMGRYVTVRRGDTVVVAGHELDVTVLEQIVNPDPRVLWAFVRNDAGDVQPVAYDETRVIWLADEDLVRNDRD
jgi:hypothetical protein